MQSITTYATGIYLRLKVVIRYDIYESREHDDFTLLRFKPCHVPVTHPV